MRISRLFSRPALFSVSSGDVQSLGETLSPRQRALLVGAVNFHALDNPGASLRVAVYVASRGSASALTDTTTRHRPHGRPHWIGEFAVVSDVSGKTHQHFSPHGKGLAPEAETGERHIVLDQDPSGDEGTSLTSHGLYWGTRAAIERRFPSAYDRVRQRLLRAREASLLTARIPRADHNPNVSPIGARTDGPPAVLFGLHWLDLGGAERWAMKTIEAAGAHGLTPIVITDVASTHPWITRPELDEAIVLPLTHPIGQPEYSEPVLDAIVSNWDLHGVFVHHCRWLYDRLPWLRRRVPSLPVVTSHHILEYNGGGYPAFGVMVDDSIDVHHVISPQLRDWLSEVQGIEKSKIVLAPLVGLTVDTPRALSVQPRIDPRVIRVGFIGRFAHQKRPYLFLKLVEELRQRLGTPVHAVIQGGGTLEPFVQREIERHRLRHSVTLRGEGAPVDETLRMIDLLVISSQNEGLALTALEAIAAGVPVVSADVGSQRTVIAPDALVDREPKAFVERATEIIGRAADSEAFREGLWREEARLVDEFSTLETADTWLERTMTEWSK